MQRVAFKQGGFRIIFFVVVCSVINIKTGSNHIVLQFDYKSSKRILKSKKKLKIF